MLKTLGAGLAVYGAVKVARAVTRSNDANPHRGWSPAGPPSVPARNGRTSASTLNLTLKLGRSVLDDLRGHWNKAKGETDREVARDVSGTSSGHAGGLRSFMSEFSKFAEGAMSSLDRGLDARADRGYGAGPGGSASWPAFHDRGAVVRNYQSTWDLLKGAVEAGLKSTDALRNPQTHGQTQRYLAAFSELKKIIHAFNAEGRPAEEPHGYGPMASLVPPLHGGPYGAAAATGFPGFPLGQAPADHSAWVRANTLSEIGYTFNAASRHENDPRHPEATAAGHLERFSVRWAEHSSGEARRPTLRGSTFDAMKEHADNAQSELTSRLNELALSDHVASSSAERRYLGSMATMTSRLGASLDEMRHSEQNGEYSRKAGTSIDSILQDMATLVDRRAAERQSARAVNAASSVEFREDD